MYGGFSSTGTGRLTGVRVYMYIYILSKTLNTPKHTGNDLRKVRNNQRYMDIAESEQLLLELASVEPTIQQCFKIIESTCLSQVFFQVTCAKL